MLETFDRLVGAGVLDKSCDWRMTISAWLVAVSFAALFAAADTLASIDHALPQASKLAGVVIPRHDPSFPGPDEVAASDWLERVRAEAYGAN